MLISPRCWAIFYLSYLLVIYFIFIYLIHLLSTLLFFIYFIYFFYVALLRCFWHIVDTSNYFLIHMAFAVRGKNTLSSTHCFRISTYFWFYTTYAPSSTFVPQNSGLDLICCCCHSFCEGAFCGFPPCPKLSHCPFALAWHWAAS